MVNIDKLSVNILLSIWNEFDSNVNELDIKFLINLIIVNNNVMISDVYSVFLEFCWIFWWLIWWKYLYLFIVFVFFLFICLLFLNKCVVFNIVVFKNNFL